MAYEVTLEAIADGWVASFALLLSRWEQGLKGPVMGLILVPLYNRYFLVRLCRPSKRGPRDRALFILRTLVPVCSVVVEYFLDRQRDVPKASVESGGIL